MSPAGTQPCPKSVERQRSGRPPANRVAPCNKHAPLRAPSSGATVRPVSCLRDEAPSDFARQLPRAQVEAIASPLPRRPTQCRPWTDKSRQLRPAALWHSAPLSVLATPSSLSFARRDASPGACALTSHVPRHASRHDATRIHSVGTHECAGALPRAPQERDSITPRRAPHSELRRLALAHYSGLAHSETRAPSQKQS
jgi:hypothetical protein